MTSVFFYIQPTIKRLLNNCVKLYWYKITSSRNMTGGQTDTPPPE